MWNSSQSAGGFMNDTATTPSKGSAGGGKNKKQNIVPVILFWQNLKPCPLYKILFDRPNLAIGRLGLEGTIRNFLKMFIVCMQVMINEVLTAPEEGFTVEGMEVRAFANVQTWLGLLIAKTMVR